MKFTVSTTLALLASSSSVQAFAPPMMAFMRPTSRMVLQASTADAAEQLIKDAVAISEKYGKDSPEARLAWETVEEINASDNSEATKGSLDECDVTQDWIDKACLEYSAKLDELDQLLKETKNSAQPSVDQVQPIKLADVPQQKAGEQSEQLKEALLSAQSLTKKHGIHSAEARVAWETVEEIASASERSDALGGKLSADECLLDAAMDACAALTELNRVIDNKPN